MFIKCFSITVFFKILFIFLILNFRSYSVTWYTVSSGNIQSDPMWSLSGFPPGSTASALGGFSDSVHIVIQSGMIADVNNITSTDVGNVTVMPGGKLYNSGGSNRYLNLFGNIECNGMIGDGLQYNPISFNIEGDTCEITGMGQFDCSRIRKNSNINSGSVLVIDMEVRLWYEQFSAVAFYNNSYGGRFDVIIQSAGALRLLGVSGNASFSMDGTNGAGLFDNHGAVDIYGTLEVSGTFFMSNNNPSPGDSCSFIVHSNGRLKAGSVDASSGLSALSRIIVEGGGILELSGDNPFVNFSLLGNEISLDVNSITIYSCYCDQDLNHELDYGELVLTGNGIKYFIDTTLIKNDLLISTGAKAAGGNAFIELHGDWISDVPDGFISEQGHISFNGSSDQIFSSSGADSLHAMTLSKPGGKVYLTDTLIITGTLVFDDGFLVSSDTSALVVDGTASVTGSSADSFVDGPVIKKGNSDFIFPVGDSIYFKPLVLLSLSGSSEVNVSYIREDPMVYGFDVNSLDTGLTHISRCEFWKISTQDPVTSQIGINWDSSSCGISDPSYLRIARWSGLSWINEYYSTITGNVLQGDIISYDYVPLVTDSTLCVTLGSASAAQNPLPVKLLDFSLEQVSEGVIVKWVTSSEFNSGHFVVERLNDSGEFVFLSSVPASGFSVVHVQYDILDDAPLSGENCYRLKQFDLDGDSVLYKPECITLEPSDLTLQCFPNPVSEQINLLAGLHLPDLYIVIVDGSGRKWMEFHAGEHVYQDQSVVLGVGHLPSGLYQILAYSDKETVHRCRFIVL